MRKLFLKLGILSLPFVLFFVFSIFENPLFNKASFYKINKPVSILIMGNSHPECGLNDTLIDGSLNQSFSGEPYFYTYFKLQKFAEANPNIHTIILDYSNVVFANIYEEYIYGEDLLGLKYAKYWQILPLEQKMLIAKKSPAAFLIATKDVLKAHFKLLFKKGNLYERLTWGEYSPITRNTIPKLRIEMHNKIESHYEPNKIAHLNLSYLKKIVAYCEEKKLHLILLRTPVHELHDKDYETELQAFLKNDLHNTTFWDYANYHLDDKEFADLDHLNYSGAKKFTKVISQRLTDELAQAKSTQKE